VVRSGNGLVESLPGEDGSRPGAQFLFVTFLDGAHLPYVFAALLAALLIGLSKGGLSMLGSLATPVFALVASPVRAAAILLPILVVSDLFGLWSYRKQFDRRNLAILIPAGIAGIAIGWATASVVSDRAVGLMIGVIGIAYCLNTWRLRHRKLAPQRADVPRGAFWGAIMGFSSFISHTGGPPLQVYVLPQQLPKLVFAGTTTIVFAAMNLVKLLPYWMLGQFSTSNIKTSLLLMPIAIAGTIAGVRLVKVLPERIYYIVVQTMLWIVSVKLILDAAAI
jgi:uncharacterized protein